MLATVIAGALAAMRPLPVPSTRPLPSGPTHFIDPARGDDAATGDARHPWKTLAFAITKLTAGDTLVLHGGVYYESVAIRARGTTAAPITIRSAPGELAILDGGLREFAEAPTTAWEPVGRGEYRSTKAYPDLPPDDERGVPVAGNFADSMVPLHGYRFAIDLRATNEYWNLPDKVSTDHGVYVGPGVWLDPVTHRIHARLAPITLASLAKVAYRGESDPRKLALVIAGRRTPLRFDHAAHVHLDNVVVRGSAAPTIDIAESDHVTLDGVAIFGGSPAISIKSTAYLGIIRSTVRGLAAPWSSRASLKYRGSSPYLLVADSHAPRSHDWDISYSDFTDSHDGLIVDSIKTLRFHHNRIDNLDDDGLYLTVPPRDAVPEDVWIYANYISRTLTALAFADSGQKTANAIGPGVHVFRNVFDLRDGTYGWPAKDAASDTKLDEQPSRLCGDHGSPIWDPILFYNNTVITRGPSFRGYYGAGIVMNAQHTKRRALNNIFMQLDGAPGGVTPPGGDDLVVDGNLMWSVQLAGKGALPKGVATHTHDVYGDPHLANLAASTLDVRVQQGSAAIDAGVVVPKDWPDPLRKLDAGKPDIGALPLGAPPLVVGAEASP